MRWRANRGDETKATIVLVAIALLLAVASFFSCGCHFHAPDFHYHAPEQAAPTQTDVEVDAILEDVLHGETDG